MTTVSKKTTSKKKVSKKAPAKKVAKKAPAKKASKLPMAVDAETQVSTIMGSIELTNKTFKDSVNSLVKHVSKCGDILTESGGVMALTNHLKELLPVGETKSLDVIHDTLDEFKKKDALISTGIKNAQARVEATAEYKALQKIKGLKDISNCYSKVFMNVLDANVVFFQDNFQNSIETPLGRTFRYRANPSLKISDVEQLPSEFKNAQLTLKNIDDVEKAKKLLADAGIEIELEYTISSEQKSALKTRIAEFDKQHVAFMSATEEEREQEGLEDVNEEDRIKGAEATWKAGVDGDFGKLKY